MLSLGKDELKICNISRHIGPICKLIQVCCRVLTLAKVEGTYNCVTFEQSLLYNRALLGTCTVLGLSRSDQEKSRFFRKASAARTEVYNYILLQNKCPSRERH